MTILYVETNFIMSIATGRDPDASLLLSSANRKFHIVLPSVCYLEAISTLESERKRNNQFRGTLEQRIAQSRRDVVWPDARLTCAQLEQASQIVLDEFNEIERRLLSTILELSDRAEAIEASPTIVRDGVNQRIIAGDLADNLILHSIVHHARSAPADVRAFLSGNTKDFGKEDARTFLQDAGVTKFFSKSRPFLDWVDSQSTTG
jgi:hypothetical protein